MKRDIYADLLSDTRGMRRDQAKARDRWYAELQLDQKESRLFELEMLLKSFACFTNPRNHTGVPGSIAIAAHDYRHEMRVISAGVEQTSHCIRDLLGERDRAFVFSRYLETVMPEDGSRHELLQHQLSQFTPEESLFVLRNAFAAFGDLASGLRDLGRIPHRVHNSLTNTITREIARSDYFNPLVTLEFRPEFDRIRSAPILSALHGATPHAHRVLALTFLALFRLLRYLSVVDTYAKDPRTERLAFLILAVFRSDARALCYQLEERTSGALAKSFEKRIYSVSAVGIHSERDTLNREMKTLDSLRGTLESVGQSIRLEGALVLSRELPSPEDAPRDGSLGPRLVVASASLRAILHHGIVSVANELDDDVELGELGSTEKLALESSLRLRRDVWGFRQVLRAFLAKADGAAVVTDHWNSYANFSYVREFLEHFRAIGYQLARRSDYPAFDRFLDSVGHLREVDLLDPERMDEVIEECRQFMTYLGELFTRINRRADLAPHPFDRLQAAEHLRLYLGAA
ncbi:MAG: hypothetical protein ACI9KE_004695 [Polyangiales bacterium]|jgi:hypothetical protein